MDGKKNKQPMQESGSKKNYAVYAIVALMAVVALAAVFFGMQAQPEAKEAGASAFFFSSMDKMMNATEYSLVFKENVSGIENRYVIVQAKNGMFASAENSVDKREFYVLDEGQYACEKFGDFSVCANMRANSSALGFFNAKLRPKFLGRAQVEQDKEFVAVLEKFGAAVFEGTVEDKAVNGLECKQVVYALDYGKLSLNQLNQLGIAANSPLVTQFSDYKISLCLDEASGIAVQTVLSYKFGTEQRSYTREYESLKVGSIGELKAPLNIESTAKFEDIFARANAELAVYAACNGLVASEEAKCYKGIALDRWDDRFCAKISDLGEAEKCYLMVAVVASQPAACEKAGKLRDDCFFEIGAGTNDAGVCEMIGNSSMLAECRGIVENETAKNPANQTQKPARKTECVADSDCVPTGCSNTVCAPASAQVATTCEYSPVYACFEKAFCGCRQGTCSWYKGEEYNACVSDFETLQTENVIKEKVAELNQTAENAPAGNSTK